jgi:hypothetical protein
MDKELGRMWKETIVALFKVLSRHLPGWAEENHEVSVISHDRLYPASYVYSGLTNTKQLYCLQDCHVLWSLFRETSPRTVFTHEQLK